MANGRLRSRTSTCVPHAGGSSQDGRTTWKCAYGGWCHRLAEKPIHLCWSFRNIFPRAGTRARRVHPASGTGGAGIDDSRSGEDGFEDGAVDVGEAEVAAGVAVGEAL